MLSPILPCIFSTLEDIPTIDIFAASDDISATGRSRPEEKATSASLAANSFGQADACGGLEFDHCGGKRARKATACETELEMSVESSTEAQRDRPRKKSLLEGLECRGAQFDAILVEDDSFELNSGHFLGKRNPRDFEEDNEVDYPQLHKRQSTPCPAETTPLTHKALSSAAEARRFCGLGHRLGISNAATGDCHLCRSVLSTIQRYAQEKGGSLVSDTLAPEVTLRCERRHQWSVCYKKATRSWCKDCKHQRKQLLKEMLEEENQRIFAERKMKQEKLFQEARQHVKSSQAAGDE